MVIISHASLEYNIIPIKLLTLITTPNFKPYSCSYNYCPDPRGHHHACRFERQDISFPEPTLEAIDIPGVLLLLMVIISYSRLSKHYIVIRFTSTPKISILSVKRKWFKIGLLDLTKTYERSNVEVNYKLVEKITSTQREMCLKNAGERY